MHNPILANFWGKTLFIVWWIAVAAIHFTIISAFYHIPIHIALLDSFIWNFLFALISIGLWYWVRITDIERSKPISILINHIGAASISIGTIATLHSHLLSNLYSKNEIYIAFVDSSFPGRLITGTLFYLLIVLVYYLVSYIKSFRLKVTQEAELKALVKDAELSWLKLQVNPHFLFNSLNSVSSLTMSSPEKAQEMITRLSELLRYSLKQSPDSMVTLKDEIDNCTKYLEIEKVRFGKRLEYNLEIPADLLDSSVPSMIMQPLFENAIKHSVAQSAETSYIEADISRDRFGLVIKVSNTLPEYPSSAKGTGVGLENIKRRLTLIYGLEGLIDVLKSESNFTVTLRIPLNSIEQ